MNDLDMNYFIEVLKLLRFVKLSMKQIAAECGLQPYILYNVVSRRRCNYNLYYYVMNTIERNHKEEYETIKNVIERNKTI